MKTILLIEDDPDYQEVVKQKLQAVGFDVLTASNGEEGLNLVNTASIDLILLDMVMPGMDGVSVYYKLREELKKNTPVIILTNLTESAYPEGIADFIVKANTSLDDLVDKVTKSLPL